MNQDEDEPGFTKPAKVYVTQEGAWVNLEGARKYGEVISIVPRDVGSLDTTRVRSAIHKIFLEDTAYDPYRDYILICGNSVVVAEVLMTMQTWGHYPRKYLTWDFLVNDYVVREFEPV